MTPVTPAVPVTFTVDPWDPGYGLAFSEDLDGGALGESSAELNLDLERPAAEWHPIDPNPVPRLPGTVLFLDGVRRIDARIWVHGINPQPGPGIAASFAAGLVSCDGAARIANVTVERGMFTAVAEATDITTRHARYPVRLASSGEPDQLSLALQQRLTEAEVQLALTFRAQNPAGDDLLVVDGPSAAAPTSAGQSATSKPTTRLTCPASRPPPLQPLCRGSGPRHSRWAPHGDVTPGISSYPEHQVCPGPA